MCVTTHKLQQGVSHTRAGHLPTVKNISPAAVSQDEEWFRLVHVQIEVACASAVAGLPAMQAAAQAGDAPRVQAGCEAIRAALAEAQRVLARMEEKVRGRCSPQHPESVEPWG